MPEVCHALGALVSIYHLLFHTQIERIQNRPLFQQYHARKMALERQNGKDHPNEQQLWHGTSPDTVPKINKQGFNRSFCGKNGKMEGMHIYWLSDPPEMHGPFKWH